MTENAFNSQFDHALNETGEIMLNPLREDKTNTSTSIHEESKINVAISTISDSLSELSTEQKQIVWRTILQRRNGWISGIDEGSANTIVTELSQVNIEQEFKDFLRLRINKKKNYYFHLAYLSLILFVLAMLVNYIGDACTHYNENGSLDNDYGLYIYFPANMIAALIRAFSITLFAVIPIDELDTISVLMDPPNVLYKFFVAISMAILSGVFPLLVRQVYHGHIYAFPISVAIGICNMFHFLWVLREHFVYQPNECYRKFVTKYKVFLVSMTILDFIIVYILASATNDPELSILILVWLLEMCTVVLWQTYTQYYVSNDVYHRSHIGAYEFNFLLLTFFAGLGLSYISTALILNDESHDDINQINFGMASLAISCVLDILPIVIVHSVGGTRLIEYVIKYLPWLNFDNKIEPLQIDGVFMSVLVLSCHVHSETVWVWRKQNDENKDHPYHEDPIDPAQINRKFWLKGKRNLESSNFRDTIDIEIDYNVDTDRTWQMMYKGMELQESKVPTSHASASTKMSPSFEEWLLTVSGESVSARDLEAVVVKQDLKKQHKEILKTSEELEEKKKELHSFAMKSLRKYTYTPLHWTDYSIDSAKGIGLLRKSPREMGGEEEKKLIYSLSEEVGQLKSESDKIDYFISHSWVDDPKLKAQELRKFSEEFRVKRGRYPTYWFDKVCIDQIHPEMGIATLPINLNACKGVLVLMGPTYMERLWCIWELFTLFTFRKKEHARSLLEIRPFGAAAMKKAKKFDIDKAHCFDPNEELKLRYLMLDLIGADKVTESINAILDDTRFDVVHE